MVPNKQKESDRRVAASHQGNLESLLLPPFVTGEGSVQSCRGSPIRQMGATSSRDTGHAAAEGDEEGWSLLRLEPEISLESLLSPPALPPYFSSSLLLLPSTV